MRYGISPNLKVAESTEVEILKQETLEELFDEKYEMQDKEFLETVNMYTSYKGDEDLKEVILDIYTFMQSTPFPRKWLEEKVELFNIEDMAFEKTVWGEVLFETAKDELQGFILILKQELESLKCEDDTEKFIVTISEDIRKIEEVYNSNSWDEMYEGVNNLKLDRFPVDKKVPTEITDRIKKKRSKIKDGIKDIANKIMIYNSQDAIDNIKSMYSILLKIKQIILDFDERFAKVKKDKNIMDFNDIEHFALEILTRSRESKVYKKYQEKYEEILIDEYQDSNLVQETILNSISRGNNIFMVGDIKQSIYRFRQARPELFLDKYERYKNIEELKENEDLKIKLFKNFRSRKNVLDLTNIIFDSIMCKELGDIDYNESEYLNLGAKYEEGENLEAELHILDLKEEEESIYKEENDEEEIEERIEDEILEAKFVAKKIKEIVDSKMLVTIKDKKREIKYKDIAVLLRSTKNLAPIYEQEISKLNIPVFCDTSSRIP